MKTIHLVGCIKRDIMRWVNRNSNGSTLDLSVWFCGVTSKSNISKLDELMKEKPESSFRKWLANETSASIEIMRFFNKNGMKAKVPKPDQNANYVFVFKINSSNMDDISRYLE